ALVAGAAGRAMPLAVAPRRGGALARVPRHPRPDARPARAERRGRRLRRGRVRLGRRGPLVSGVLRTAPAAGPRPAAVPTGIRGRAARAGDPLVPVPLTSVAERPARSLSEKSC